MKMAPKTTGGMFAGSKFSFTEARLEQARKAVLEGVVDTVADGRRSWLDADCAGLRFTVNSSTGSSVFYYQGKVNGTTVRRALGDTDAVRLVEAREAVRRLRYDRTVTGALAPRKRGDGEPADRTPVVKGVLDDMLAAHASGRWLPGTRSKPPSDRTVKFYCDLRRAAMVEKIRRKRKGTDEYETVDGEDFEQLTLQAFADRLGDIYAKLQKRAPIQANRALQLWRNLYAFAADSKLWSQGNPVLGKGKADRLTKTPEQARTKTLTEAEWKRLDKAMAADAPLWRDLFTMSMLSLQRMGAVCHARWDDITLTGPDAAWRIPAKWMKGRRSGHVVPLASMPQLLELLRVRRKAVPKTCPWVFPAMEGDGPVTTYKTAWRRILEQAKLWSDDKDERPRPHDLRRTGGERMTSAGIPLQTVTKALGDAPSSAGMVAKVYAQVADAALKDAYSAMSRRGSRRR
jgi:integrase